MLAPDTLAARFAQRIASRDTPPPLSHEPAAVLARVADWLRAGHPQRDRRTGEGQARLLLALMEHPVLNVVELMPLVGREERATTRIALALQGYGLTTFRNRAGKRYWRLTRPAEDALLAVVAGPETARAAGSPADTGQ